MEELAVPSGGQGGRNKVDGCHLVLVFCWYRHTPELHCIITERISGRNSLAGLMMKMHFGQQGYKCNSSVPKAQEKVFRTT